MGRCMKKVEKHWCRLAVNKSVERSHEQPKTTTNILFE